MPSSSKSRSVSKSVKENCAYLKGHYSLNELIKICKVLNVETDNADTIQTLCSKLQKQRPDLMRGKFWNYFRLMNSANDLTNNAGRIMTAVQAALYGSALSSIAKNPHMTHAEWGTQHNKIAAIYSILGANAAANVAAIAANKKSALTPHANYHIERHEAYKLLGKDPRTRKRFGKYV